MQSDLLPVPRRALAAPLRFRCAALAARLLAIGSLLSACGGGGDSPPITTATPMASTSAPSSDARELAQSLPSGTIPANANLKGMWSPVYNWPLVAVHSVLMPDGRVMTYGSNGAGQQTGKFIYDLWDSSAAPGSAHLTLPNGSVTDIFCSSQLLLPQSGSVFIAGGDNWNGTATTNVANSNSNVFDGKTNTIKRGPDMSRTRWYSTSTTLLNGETYIQGGSGGGDYPEVRSVAGTFKLLTGAPTATLHNFYPRNFIAPDGRLFGYDINGLMYFIDPMKVTNGVRVGAVTRAGQINLNNVGWTSSSAMFSPGRILQIGGNSNAAVIVDIRGANPVVTATQSMSTQRQWVNATVLPDGRVLATSGSQVANQLVGVNNSAEIWDPRTGQWTVGPSSSPARLYHSNALLLPDGSVLVSGGGAAPNAPTNNLNAEVYFPSYLFAANGKLAVRPRITAGPDSIEIGKVFNLTMADAGAVSRVTLVKTGSTTHSFNMEQRFSELTFSANGTALSIQAPTRAGEAPPGYYQVFVFNAAGVPSIAKIVRMGVASNPNPAFTPSLTNPGAQTGQSGTAASLALKAGDPNGDVLSYRAAGLPPGLTLNAQSGVISGAPTANGSYNVVATASDGVNTASASFVWTVNGTSSALVLNPPSPPPPVVANGSANFSASATGNGLRFKWNFGDGTAETAWSTSGNASHVYTRPGTYNVTVSVTDSSNALRSTSLLQAIYLPATAKKPSQSSNLVFEQPTTGNGRLWVVNPDNDSVSAFDAVTRGKLGEVAVGSAPRAIALAPNGLLWVTNKASASISVINPATRAVVRTIALPRGTQPFGIAMSPTAPQAFVALQAGRLLKFDTNSYAQTGQAPIGMNIRHVSVAADGVSVYATRLITQPLPGEGTAVVSTPANVGGEVIVLNSATMSPSRIIVLRHGDKPDFENQGRGIPNYLGAAAISPDDTQVWVPSKQDNIKRGGLRDGQPLNFQNTVRAISSRLLLASGTEDIAKRIDHDNASVASAALFDPRGVYLFVALETSREVAVIDAFGGYERMRITVGRAPQGLALSADGNTLYVSNMMDRNVSVFDTRPLLQRGQLSLPQLATLNAVGSEKLAGNVLVGKQLFYDARDTRLARDRYMSCASCHNDGGFDGRTWDLTSLGEGLRNTPSLRGRAGAQGPLHWSGNFDEVQDFEGQIRTLAGGTGLMSDAAFNTGTRKQPLGDKKAGLSADLDALAAYVGSLKTFDADPLRSDNGTATGALSSAAVAGRAVFIAQNCASCHGGTAFTSSGTRGLVDIGTLKPSSGKRLGAALTGIDVPTLRDIWATAPYLHDGSAPTLEAAVGAHRGVSLSAADLASLVNYLRQIGAEEASAPSR